MVVAILGDIAVGITGQRGLEVTQGGCFRSPDASIGQGDRYRYARFGLGINRWPA